MNPTTPIQTTAFSDDETLDTLLQGLCDVHGLAAVGKALARQHGRTRVIAAVLGQLQDATSSTSSSPSPLDIPANTL
ncbi:MAG: hypothetical protein F6J95_030985 [Leptolyngbya sp. SIO1E4]|nr:hypothetical protein [Leptolyngbya sp. SIO1E4]